MIQKIQKMKAQSTLEYAILVVIVIAALLSLQAYIKRGIQGRLRKSTDDIGDQFSVTDSSYYKRSVNSLSHTNETNVGGQTTTKQNGEISTNTTEKITLGDRSAEFGN